MCETINKWIRQTFCDYIIIVIIGIPANVEHRFLYIPHIVPQQINSHHRYGISILALRHQILRIGIMHTEILSEAKCLRLEPCLLQFYQNQL